MKKEQTVESKVRGEDSGEKIDIGIPALDWGLRIQKEIHQCADPLRKKELQDFLDRLWVECQLIGLYE